MPVSHLTSSRAELLAALLNVLDEEANASALTMTEAELLAAIRNTYGGSVSALTTSQAGLLASIEIAAGGSGNALTESHAQMLAGLLTARGGSGSYLTLSEGELLAGIANIPAEGGGSYTAQAVHFDGSTWLGIASLTATDNDYLSFAIWSRIADGDQDSATLYVSDPNNYNAYSIGAEPDVGEASFEVQAASADGTKNLSAVATGNAFPIAQWNCIIATLEASSGVLKIYNKDTDVSSAPTAVGGAFTNAFNALEFFVGGDGGGGLIGDLADVRIMPGVSLLTDGDISQATRRLFVDASGKPVNPAAATASLGTPAVLFSRSGAASTFATNQGSGGAFTLTGSLTASGTSPSD